MTTEQLTALWESVTVGQAIVFAVAAWLVCRLALVVFDGVRALARRRTSADEDRDDELVEQVEQLRQTVGDHASDLYQTLDAIRTDQTDGREVLDEQLAEAKAIRAACERLVAVATAPPPMLTDAGRAEVAARRAAGTFRGSSTTPSTAGGDK